MWSEAAVPLIGIVDDDESVRDSISSLMKSVGYRTAVFASAEAFLNSEYTSNANGLILLLDIRMPGSSGLELQRRLADLKCSIPIIFVTADGDDGDRAIALNEGALAFIIKPFSDISVLGAIHSALKVQPLRLVHRSRRAFRSAECESKAITR
jgi:FixJ family two-component response regulator